MNGSGYSTYGKRLIVLLAVFLSMFMVQDSHAQQKQAPLILTDEQDTYDLLDHLEIYVDATTGLTFDQVPSQDFKPANDVDTMSGEAAYWLRLDVENEALPSTSWLLIYNTYNINQLSAYIPDGAGFREIHTGNTFPFSSREYDYHYYVFELKTPPGGEDTLYLRLYDVAGVRLPSLEVQSLARFSQRTATEGFWNGGYYAMILTILLYNILFLMSLKERGNVGYILLVGSILLMSLTVDGYGHQYLWPNWILWADKGILISFGLLLVSIAYYTLSVLDVREHFPKWVLGSRIIIAFILAVASLRLTGFVNQDLLLWPLLLVFLAGILLPVILAFKMRKLQRRQATIIITAFAVLAIYLSVSIILLGLGFSPPGTLFLEKGPFIWLLFVFAFATNDRIREIREQQEQAQQALVQEQQNTLSIKSDLIGELEDKNTELERFAYTVSHDLRSPLVTIKGFLGYLERDAVTGDTSRLKDDMQRISNAVGKMQDLLNDLLELSRIGRLMNELEDIPFADLAQDAMDIVHGQLDERHVTVQTHPNLPIVHGDRQRLTEVLQNLLDNAVKYIGDQPEPLIEIGQDGDENGMPVLFVKDNGMGIPPEYHEQIFGLFNQLDAKSDGTGIGLAIVKRVIEFHGGRIWVESEGNAGSTFYFTLPGTPSSD